MAKKASPGATRAAVDRDARDGIRARADRPAAGCGDKVVEGPQRAGHAASSAGERSRATASWSENGMASPPTIWPVSWPLPATQSTSPGRSIAIARRIASRAIADLDRPGRGREDRLADRRRLLGARIVVGDDDDVGVLGAAAPMSGRLPGSRSPPAPKTTMSRPRVIGPQRRERARERVRLVGVVDEDQRAVRLVADELEPAGRAFELGRARRARRRRSMPAPMASPAATSAFDAWKAPASGSRISCAAPKASMRRRWRKPFGSDIDDAQLAPRASGADERVAAPRRPRPRPSAA